MENAKPVLVVGATGFLGTELCKQLLASGKKVRALVRKNSDPSKIQQLKERGIETVTGDLKDADSLLAACNNVGAVISTASCTFSRQEGDSIETVDRQGQLKLVDAANESGVEKFVFISFLESKQSFPLQDAKREVEQKLMESKMDYTILRPSFFMDIWLSPQLGFDPANHKVTIYGHGAAKVSWIASKDVAAFAVASLTNAAASKSIIDIGGPQALSQLEVVKIFEEQAGTKFELQYVPEEALRTQKEVSPDPLQQSFSALMLTLNEGSAAQMDELLELFPLKLTSVLDYSHILMASQVEA